MSTGGCRAARWRSWSVAVLAISLLSACADQTQAPETPPIDLSAHGTVPQSGAITVNAAIRAALANSPEVGVATAQLNNAEAGIDAATAATRPTVDLTGTSGLENTYTEGPSNIGEVRTEVGLSVEQTIFDFGANENGIARRQALASSAEFLRRDAMEDVALDTVLSYLEFLRQSQLIAAARRNVDNHQRIADLVTLSEEGGNATQADVARAATRLEAAKSAQLNAQNAREDALDAFQRLANIDPGRVAVPSRLAPPSRGDASAIKAALLANPELQALLLERQALERQLAQQTAARKPRIFVRGEGNFREDVGGDTNTAGDLRALVGFNVRLYSGGLRRAQIRQTEARLREIDELYRATLRDLEQETEEVNQTLQTAQENTAFATERFNTARDGLELFEAQFEGGERTAFELLDAQRDFFQAESELIDNRFQTAASVYEDLRLRGVLVSTVMSAP